MSLWRNYLDMRWLQIDKDDIMVRKSLRPLTEVPWKVQHNFDQYEDNHGDQTIKRLEVCRNEGKSRPLHACLWYSVARTEFHKATDPVDWKVV